ncbi:MAG: alpha/beta hydrolase [Candidatus Omnitrophota bacterium]
MYEIVFFLIISAFFVFVLWLLNRPVETESLCSRPGQSTDYSTVVKTIERMVREQERDAAGHGRSLLLTHGQRTERVIVFFHGYTNCPRQFEMLSQRFFEMGFSVYAPRVPHHGLRDLMTGETSQLTAEELRRVCDSSVDLASGLGDRVAVLGVSMGGVMAAWCAQFRDDVQQAALIAPSFGWHFLPGMIRPLINLTRIMPNILLWWDPIHRRKRDKPFSMYHRFSSRGMGQIMRLGLSVLEAAKKHPPACRDVVMITNEMDIAVDDANIEKLTESWRSHGVHVLLHRFSKDLAMEHDIIDPLHPYARPEQVYDTILQLMRV